MLHKGLLAVAALLTVTASPAYSQVVLSEDFSGGFGIFTPSASGNLSINTRCCRLRQVDGAATVGTAPLTAQIFRANREIPPAMDTDNFHTACIVRE